MKKNYIKPIVTVTVINSVNMIAASLGNGTTSFSEAQNGEEDEYGDTKESGSWSNLWE
jgi:hypothetical protein